MLAAAAKLKKQSSDARKSSERKPSRPEPKTIVAPHRGAQPVYTGGEPTAPTRAPPSGPSRPPYAGSGTTWASTGESGGGGSRPSLASYNQRPPASGITQREQTRGQDYKGTGGSVVTSRQSPSAAIGGDYHLLVPIRAHDYTDRVGTGSRVGVGDSGRLGSMTGGIEGIGGNGRGSGSGGFSQRGVATGAQQAVIPMQVNGGTGIGVGSKSAYHPGPADPGSADAGPAGPSPAPVPSKQVDTYVVVRSNTWKCRKVVDGYISVMRSGNATTYDANTWDPLVTRYKDPTRVVIYVDDDDIVSVHDKLRNLSKHTLRDRNITIQYLYTKDKDGGNDNVRYIIPPDLFDDNAHREKGEVVYYDNGGDIYIATPTPRTGNDYKLSLVATSERRYIDDHIRYYDALEKIKVVLDYTEKGEKNRLAVTEYGLYRSPTPPSDAGLLVINITHMRAMIRYGLNQSVETADTYEDEAELVRKWAHNVTGVMFVDSAGDGFVTIGRIQINVNVIIHAEHVVDWWSGSAGAGGSRAEQPSVPSVDVSALPKPDTETEVLKLVLRLSDSDLADDTGDGARLIGIKAGNIGLEDRLAEVIMLDEAGLDAQSDETKKQGATMMTHDECIAILKNEINRRLGSAVYREGKDADIVKFLVNRAMRLIAPLRCNIIIRGKKDASEQRVKEAAATVFNGCVKRAETLSAEVAGLKNSVYTDNVITELEKMVGAKTQDAIKELMKTSLSDLKVTRNLELTRVQVIGTRKARKETPGQKSVKDEARALFDEMKMKAEESVNRMVSDASNIALAEMANDAARAEKERAGVERKTQRPGVDENQEKDWKTAFWGYINTNMTNYSKGLRGVMYGLLNNNYRELREYAIKENKTGEQVAATLLPVIKAESEKIIQEKNRAEADAKREEERKREEQERKRVELERALATRKNNSATRIQALQRGRAARSTFAQLLKQRKDEQRKEEQRKADEEQRKAAEQRNTQEAAKVAYVVVATGPQVTEASVQKVINDRNDIFDGYMPEIRGEYDSTVEHLNNPNAAVIIATKQAVNQITDKKRYLPIMCKEIYIKDLTNGVTSRLESAGYKKQSQKPILTLTGNRDSYTKFTFSTVPVSWYSTGEWSLFTNPLASADCKLAGGSTSKEYVADILNSIAYEKREISAPGNLKENDDLDLRALGYVLVSCVDKDKLKNVAVRINERMPRSVLILGSADFMNKELPNVREALAKYNVSEVKIIEAKINDKAPNDLKGKASACVIATLRLTDASGVAYGAAKKASFGRPGIMMRFV